MAGIGEATAIIAVAQIGIQASKSIFEFVGEVKDAPKEIRRVGRDICTTSERLEEIGRLIDNNHTSRFFNQGGIASAVRCSNDCKEIIAQVNQLLAKGGWVSESAALEKKDFDISLLDAFRWPFLRSRLASPQADLEKVKASLSLLFNSVMATASANPMQSEYALQIPKLKKWAEQATRKAENEKRRSRQGTDSSSRYVQREVHWKDQQPGDDEEDPEMRQKFIDFQVRLVKEEEERRARERAAFIQAEIEAKLKAENEARHKIEQSAIDQYKKEQDDIKLHKSEKQQRFKDELSQLGLEPEKIESIVNTTGFQELELDSAKQNLSRTRLLQTPKSEPNIVNGTSDESSVAATNMASEIKSSSRPWFPRRFSRSRMPSSFPPETNVGSMHNLRDGQSFHSTPHLQLWLVDLVSGQNVELTPSRDWLRSKVDKARYDEIAHKMAKLKHPWRTAILDFLRSRNDREPPHLTWKLCFIGLPRRVSRLAFFGHRRGDCLVRLVLCQHKLVEGDPDSLPLWPDSKSRDADDSASDNLQARSSLKTISGNYNEGLKGALRQPNDLHGKTNRQEAKAGSRGVSFAKTGELDAELEDYGTIKVDMEFVGGELRRGTTTMDEDLFPSEALNEFGLPWRKLQQEVDSETQEQIQIPEALTDDQIDQLNRITMAKIIEGEVPWRKPPKWKMHETVYEYAQKQTQPSTSNSKPRHETSTAEFAGDINRGYPRPGNDVANSSKVKDQSELFAKETNFSRETSDRNTKVPALDGRAESYRTEIVPQRRPSVLPTEIENLSRHEGPRERYLPRDNSVIQDVVATDRRHIDHGHARGRPEYRKEMEDDYYYDREGPSYRGERDHDMTVVRRYKVPETPRYRDTKDDIEPYYEREYYLDRDGSGLLVPGEYPPRARKHDFTEEQGRPSHRMFLPERPPERREREEIFIDRRAPRVNEEEIVIRERSRSRRRYDDRDDIPRRTTNRDYSPDIVIRRRPSSLERLNKEREEDIIIRHQDSPRRRLVPEVIGLNSPTTWPGYREEREERMIYRGKERERERDGQRGSVERIVIRNDAYPDRELDDRRARRRSTFASDKQAVIRESERERFGYRDDIGSRATRDLSPAIIPRYRREERDDYSHKSAARRDSPDSDYYYERRIIETGQTNDDIISNTLGEFTTFNADPIDDLAAASAADRIPDASAPSYATNLKNARQKLAELLEKLDKANKEGDFLAASDLQFYAIPDVKAMVEELKAREVRIDSVERIREVEYSEQASADGEYEPLRESISFKEGNLQPRVVALDSDDGSNTDDPAKRATNGSVHSEISRRSSLTRGISSDDAIQNGPVPATQDNIDDDPPNQAPNGEPADCGPGIVRRPTATPSVAATVQDDD